MKRSFDVIFSLILLIILSIPIAIIAFVVKLTSDSSVIYWSDRVGKDGSIFRMPKFRTMYKDTPPVATHLLKSAEAMVTPFGKILRRLSLDEFPQLFSILKGDMSFVGPRPALYNQYDLIKLRKNHSIDTLIPGLTGWAQINGRDDIPIIEKVHLDKEYLESRTFYFDLKIIFLTIVKVFFRENVSH